MFREANEIQSFSSVDSIQTGPWKKKIAIKANGFWEKEENSFFRVAELFCLIRI